MSEQESRVSPLDFMPDEVAVQFALTNSEAMARRRHADYAEVTAGFKPTEEQHKQIYDFENNDPAETYYILAKSGQPEDLGTSLQEALGEISADEARDLHSVRVEHEAAQRAADDDLSAWIGAAFDGEDS